MNILVEEWGGKFQSQEVSAKKGIGMDQLWTRSCWRPSSWTSRPIPGSGQPGS